MLLMCSFWEYYLRFLISHVQVRPKCFPIFPNLATDCVVFSVLLHTSTPSCLINISKYVQVTSTEESHSMTSDNELFILGLLKEQRQEEKDKERIDQGGNIMIIKLFLTAS